MTKEITSKVNQYGSIMQKTFIKNKFNREFAMLITIQQGVAIRLIVTSLNDLNQNLYYSH